MNCSLAIAIAVLLLSLTAGMWLLFKTQKENLNMFFTVIAWFVIVTSLGSIVCCTIRCTMYGCRPGGSGCEMGECGPNMMWQMGPGMGHGMHMMGHPGMQKRVMMFKGDDDDCMMGGCEEGMESCHGGKGECCMGEKCEGGKCEDHCKDGGDCKEGKESCHMKEGGMGHMKMDSTMMKRSK